MDYRCRVCGRVFNVYTGTALQGFRHRPGRLVMILRGFCQGVPTLHLAHDLGASRHHLLERRHHVQGLALERFPPPSLEDPELCPVGPASPGRHREGVEVRHERRQDLRPVRGAEHHVAVP